jgi:hypothetical protein
MDRLSTKIVKKKPVNIDQQAALLELANATHNLIMNKGCANMAKHNRNVALNNLIIIEQNIAAANSNFNFLRNNYENRIN